MTGEKHGNKLGQYFWGRFDPSEHSAAISLGWLREQIDEHISFWKMSPDTSIFPQLELQFRAMSWPSREYVLGTNRAADVVAELPEGTWTVRQFDVIARTQKVVSASASGPFTFSSPTSRAVLFHFRLNSNDPSRDASLSHKEGSARPASSDRSYFPRSDAAGGWRTLERSDDIRRIAGMDLSKLDDALAAAESSTKNGGVLVVRHGYLVYERYFGLGHRTATPNLASCGKSFTSIAVGILMAEYPALFPQGLDQRVFTSDYLPASVFPLSDPAKSEIRLGHLLCFTAGIRGNNPCMVRGKPVQIDPLGPDGASAMIDSVAVGQRDIVFKDQLTSAKTLWCAPGEGYSYATSAAHLASMIVRHVSGLELEDYLRSRLAEPLEWGPFTFGYRQARDVTDTPGGGGIAVRGTDMLRFGYLLLREGEWRGRQVVPRDYVLQCGKASQFNPHSAYSLQFDVNSDGQWEGVPRDAFWKSGSGGHTLYVVPSLDLVVWKLAGRDGQYGESDTGIPLPEAALEAGRSRASWRSTLDERMGQREVLRRVVESIVER